MGESFLGRLATRSSLPTWQPVSSLGCGEALRAFSAHPAKLGERLGNSTPTSASRAMAANLESEADLRDERFLGELDLADRPPFGLLVGVADTE